MNKQHIIIQVKDLNTPWTCSDVLQDHLRLFQGHHKWAKWFSASATVVNPSNLVEQLALGQNMRSSEMSISPIPFVSRSFWGAKFWPIPTHSRILGIAACLSPTHQTCSDQIRLDSSNGFWRCHPSHGSSPERWQCCCHRRQWIWSMQHPTFGWRTGIHPDFCRRRSYSASPERW